MKRWIVLVAILCVYVGVCSVREGFISTGVQVNDRMDVKETLRKINSLPVKHILILPYMGTNKLNVLVSQINDLKTSPDNIYIMVVDTNNETQMAFAYDFFSNICAAVLDLNNLVVLTRNDNDSQRYAFSESTDTVFLYKINQVLMKINNE